jgi:hypothetical protein
MTKTYAIRANRTPQDVLNNNDETIETGYTLDEARIASIQIQKTGEFVAVWKPSPRRASFAASSVIAQASAIP